MGDADPTRAGRAWNDEPRTGPEDIGEEPVATRGTSKAGPCAAMRTIRSNRTPSATSRPTSTGSNANGPSPPGAAPQGLIRLTDPAEWVTPAGPPGMNAAGGRPANP